MPKKYNFKYETPLLENYNQYPDLISNWEDKLNVKQLQEKAMEEKRKELISKKREVLKVRLSKTNLANDTEYLDKQIAEYEESDELKKRLNEFKTTDEYKHLRNKNKVLMERLNVYLEEPDKCIYENVKTWVSGKSRPRNGRQQDALDAFLKINHWQSRFKNCDEAVNYIYNIWDNWVDLLEEVRDNLDDENDNSQMFFMENTIKNFVITYVKEFPIAKELLDEMFKFGINIYNIFSLNLQKVSNEKIKQEVPDYLYNQIEAFKKAIKENDILTDMNNIYASLVRNGNKVFPKFMDEPRKYGLIEKIRNKVPNSSEIIDDELKNGNDVRELKSGIKVIDYYGEDNFEVMDQLAIEAKVIGLLFRKFRKLSKADATYNKSFTDSYIVSTLNRELFDISNAEPKDVFNCCSNLTLTWVRFLNEVLIEIGKYYIYPSSLL